MKAITPLRLAALIAPLLAAACATPPKAPAPVVVQPPVAPAPAPPPPPKAIADWRDAPQTAGTWRWTLVGGQSTSRFVGAGGAPLAALQCDRAAARLWLARSDGGSNPSLLIVRTTGLAERVLSPEAGGPAGWVGLHLPPRDPLLDAIAFSRGRFALEAGGLETLYLPAWPELSRVIEDCR